MNLDKFKLYITSLNQVQGFYDRKITHILSLLDPDQKKPYFQHFPTQPKYFRVSCVDVSHPSETLAPTETNVKYILSVAELIKFQLERDQDVNLLVHCFAGVSRSTGAAYVILNYLLGPGHEQECLNRVFAARSCMIPNELIVSLGDRLLNRDGEMFKWVHNYNKGLELNK